MAGIGFELRRILAEDTYTSLVKGFLYSTVISAGPWLMSVLCLAGLGLFSVAFLGFEERQTFASTVVYMYASSLVGTGLIQVVITRYLSDRIYQGSSEVLVEAFLPVFIVTVLIQTPLAGGVLWGAPLSGAYKVSAVTGMVTISLIWQVMIFLSASRDYLAIVLAFLLGALTSLAGGLIWGRQFGLLGYLNGFNLGQFCIFALLTLKLLQEHGLPRRWDWAFLRYIFTYPQLMGIGFFYNLSIWVDKLLFGLSPYGRITAGRFPTYNQYDSSMFLAFASVIPAMALFLSRSETDFADVYRKYYDDIFFRRPLDQILRSKRAMTQVLTSSFIDLCKVQGLITLLTVYFADDLLLLLDLPYSQAAIFRYGLIGAFLQVMMLFIHVILLYYDLRGTVLGLTLLFLLANTFFSALSLSLGFPYYGSGFAAAGLVGLLASVILLYYRLFELEYITFAKREIVGQTTAGRRHRARPGGLYGSYREVKDGRNPVATKSKGL